MSHQGDAPPGIAWKIREGVARETGLEPATSGVTGRRSNQLSYSRSGEAVPRATWRPCSERVWASQHAKPSMEGVIWWAVTVSNRRPSRCKRDALPLS